MKGSLQEKNGIYQAVLYVDGKQKWKSTGIKVQRGNKRKAEQKLIEILAEYNDNPRMFEKVDLVGYIKKWLKDVEGQVDAITFEGYKQHAKRHIIPYFEEMNLTVQAVTVGHIERYYQYKSTSGRLDGKSGGLSRASIKRHGVVLHLIFENAIKDNLIRDNPCTYAKIPKMDSDIIRKQEFYNVKQCEKLLDAVKGTALYDMIYITFLYGLRRSELIGLRWRDIDFEQKTLTIQHTVVINGIVIAKDKTKNKTSNRTYPLLDDIYSLLLERKRKQEENRKLLGCNYKDSDYVFTKKDGGTYYPDYPTKRLEKTLERYKLPHIRWHDLRHSCASMLILKGWNMKDISEWLGHADISTTMNIYGHLDLEHKRNIAKSLNGIL